MPLPVKSGGVQVWEGLAATCSPLCPSREDPQNQKAGTVGRLHVKPQAQENPESPIRKKAGDRVLISEKAVFRIQETLSGIRRIYSGCSPQ